VFGVGIAAFGAVEMLFAEVVCGLGVDDKWGVKDSGAASGAP
jgi:hypothetical protein